MRKKAKRPCPSKGLYRHFSCIATDVAKSVLRQIDSVLSRYILDCLSRGDYKGVISASADPSAYSEAGAFKDDYLAAEIMSKFPDWDLGIDRDVVALDKFLSSEIGCSETNSRLKTLFGTASTTVSVASLLYTAQRKIERLLGPFSWDEAEQYFGWGPGASTSLRRTQGDSYFKYGAKPHVTRQCAMIAYTAVRRVPRWFQYLAGFPGNLSPQYLELLGRLLGPEDLFEIVDGNRVTTVPKSAKTNRVIAIEPDMNMYVQKGIGGVIRSRLRRVGIDLNDQSRNQELALEGSLTGRLATIDLSSASDTVANGLVEMLLPPDWNSAIQHCRSELGTLPSGDVLRYQKVSSMGNGFTFELESLIFWALVSSVVELSGALERRVAVYGDDIIVSVECYEQVVELLSVCGFSTNTKKSFATGKFRESCGKHYFSGHDVTPFYIRKAVDSPVRSIWLANSIRRYARKGMPYGMDARWLPCYTSVLETLPSFWRRPRIPDSLGDIALIGDFDEVLPKRAKLGWEGWECIGYAEKRSVSTASDIPFMLKALNKLEFRVLGDDIPLGINTPLRRVVYQVVRPVTALWDNFGPWI